MKKRFLLPLLLALLLSTVFTLVPTAAEIGDGVLPSRAEAKENYDALYVPGYTTKWDGFDLTEGGALNTDIFGGDAIAGNGSLHLPGTATNLSALLPNDGTAESFVAADYTFDATVALRQCTYGGSGTRMFIGALTGYPNSHGAQIHFRTENASHPGSVDHGQISGFYTSLIGTKGENVQFRFDYSTTDKFLAGKRGEIYSFAVATDYNIGGNSATISLFRDGNQIRNATVAYPLMAGTTACRVNQILFPSNLQYDFYALRVYPFALTAEQIQQNHFVDLCKWFGISLDVYETYDSTAKKNLHEILRDETFNTITGAELQSLVDNYTVFDEEFSADTVLTFDGFQGKLTVNPGIRSIYTVNTDAIKVLEKKGYSVTVGALMAIANGRETSEITLGSANSAQTTVYKNGAIVAEKTLNKSESGFSFAYATVFNTEVAAQNYKTDMVYRGYVTLTKGNTSATFYLDAETEIFDGTELSLYDLSTVLAFLGYENRATITSVVGKTVANAASALKADFASLYGTKSEMRALVKDVALYTRYAYNIRASVLDSNKAYAKLTGTASLSYNERLDAILECENAFEAIKLCRENLIRLQNEALALKARFDDEAAFLAALTDACGTDASLVSDILSHPLSTAKTVVDNRVFDFDIQKKALDRIANDITANDSTVKGMLAEILTANDPIAFGTGVKLSEYAILTDKQNEVSARLLQAMLAKTYGVVVPYVYDMPATLQAEYALYLQNRDLDGKDYVIAQDGASALLLGSTSDNTMLAATLFARACTAGKLTLTPAEGTGILPLFDTEFPTYFEKLNLATLEEGGVYQRFLMTEATFGEELAVVQPLSSSAFPLTSKNTYFVSPDGDDRDSGSELRPFKTLQHALNQALAKGGAQIVLRGGTYKIDTTLSLTTLHSGSKNSPLYITAYPGETVTFTAADTVNGSAFAKVTDETVISRLNTFTAGNAANVYVADLASLGITEYPVPTTSGEPIFTREGDALHLARYPNAGAKASDGRTPIYTAESDIIKYCRVSNTSSGLYDKYKNETDSWKIKANAEFSAHAKRWQSENVWLHGALYAEWWRKHMPVSFAYEAVGDETNVFTMSSTVRCDWGLQYKKNNDGYFYNILEELDADGEWYLDTDNGLLYVYSSSAIGKDETFSLINSSTTLMAVNGVRNVVLNGITFAETLSYGLTVTDSEYVLVQNCTFRDIRANAIKTSDVRNCGIIASVFKNITNDAVSLAGADDSMLTMTPDRNFVQNCTFYEGASLRPSTLGSLISHNYFEYSTLQCSGIVESVIEYNEFLGGSQTTTDNGPIYCGGASHKGNHIRYNYIHDLNYSKYGIYIDDLSSSNNIYSNIVTYAEGVTGGRCVNVHGGMMNTIVGNICVGAGSSEIAAIMESSNYYVQNITEGTARKKCEVIKYVNGVPTDASTISSGYMGERWKTLMVSSYNSYVSYGGATSRFAERFPTTSAVMELLGMCLADITAKGAAYTPTAATWTHTSKDPAFGSDGFYAWLTADGHEGDLEIFLRSTLGATISSNVFIGCETDIHKVTDYGIDSSTVENNYSLTKDSEYYTQIRNGDLSVVTKAETWANLAPGFKTINADRLGIVELAAVTFTFPEPSEEDFDISNEFTDLFGK